MEIRGFFFSQSRDVRSLQFPVASAKMPPSFLMYPKECCMNRLIPAGILALLAGIVIGAAPTPPATAPATRMGLDGRPADTRPIMEPYTNTGNWMQRHEGFVTRAKQGDIDLVLLGDSITDGWNNTGRAVWQKEFAGWKMANFGIGGDTCQAVLYRINNGELDGYKAKAIMLMLGTNNTRSYSGEEIGAAMTKIVGIIKEKQPQAKLLLLAIFPRGTGPTDPYRVKVDVANKILEKLDGGNVKFLSINDKFLDKDGKLVGFNGDNLHPNAQGYQLWARG
jgi:lysophospholipase L1-like esterase